MPTASRVSKSASLFGRNCETLQKLPGRGTWPRQVPRPGSFLHARVGNPGATLPHFILSSEHSAPLAPTYAPKAALPAVQTRFCPADDQRTGAVPHAPQTRLHVDKPLSCATQSNPEGLDRRIARASEDRSTAGEPAETGDASSSGEPSPLAVFEHHLSHPCCSSDHDEHGENRDVAGVWVRSVRQAKLHRPRQPRTRARPAHPSPCHDCHDCHDNYARLTYPPRRPTAMPGSCSRWPPCPRSSHTPALVECHHTPRKRQKAGPHCKSSGARLSCRGLGRT